MPKRYRTRTEPNRTRKREKTPNPVVWVFAGSAHS